MANVPDDSKKYFTQTQLPPPEEPTINIVPSPTGSQVEDGSLSSPNFRHLQSGWKISSDGTAEFQSIRVGNQQNYISWEGSELTGSGNLMSSRLFNTYQQIDGTVTPKAVFIETDGTLLIGEADVSFLDDFDGFVVSDGSSHHPATFLNSTDATTATTISHTLNAGTDRIVMVHIQCGNASSTQVLPTSVTWNGNSMTKLLGDGTGRVSWGLWYYKAGTSTLDVTADIVITGGTDQKAVFADNYQYVDQANPFQDSDYVASTSGTSVVNSVTSTQSYSLVVQYYADFFTGFNQTMDSQLTLRHNDTSGDHNGCVADGYISGIKAITLTSTTDFGPGYSATGPGIGGAVIFNNSKYSTIPVIVGGIIGGFAGLTVGVDYYLSNTAGEISVSPGSTPIRVGKSVSSTEILIIQP